MKILGIADRSYSAGGKSFICEISESELVRVVNKSGRSADEAIRGIKVGDDYPIAEGYDFRAAIAESTRSMEAAFKTFQKVAPVMASFAALIQQREGAHEEAA